MWYKVRPGNVQIFQTIRGVDKLTKLKDVDQASLDTWDVLVWNATTNSWEWKAIEEIWALDYKWVWDADANDPEIVSSVWEKWDYYKVSVKWTTDIDWMSDREVWDLILFNGTVWQRIAWGEAYVDLTDAQTVWWVKTFTSSPVVPAPANNTDASNKIYVDWQAVAMAIALG